MSENSAPTQRAILLTGPDELEFTGEKKIHEPGEHQFLCKVLAAGICFSDLKLLKQFDKHLRKSEILSGITEVERNRFGGYVPGTNPTVPGHEVFVEVIKLGVNVNSVELGGRYLIQADWRHLKTEHSNGALGYNVEGAFQQYLLLDEAFITEPNGDIALLKSSSDKKSRASFALIEPWACVEYAYREHSRTTIRRDGTMLVVADESSDVTSLKKLFADFGTPARITVVGAEILTPADIEFKKVDSLVNIEGELFDDIVYFGADANTLETIFTHTAKGAVVNIVQGGKTFSRDIEVPVGEVHYRGVRIIGDSFSDAAAAMSRIPVDGELRPHDAVNIIGAGGPMGVMHVARNISRSIADISIYASDLSDERLAALNNLTQKAAEKAGVNLTTYNPKTSTPEVQFTYSVIMAPVPALVEQEAKTIAKGGIINIFAGIPAGKYAKLNLNELISKNIFLIGTSGSQTEDMRVLLERLEADKLNTDISLFGVSGLEGTIDGIRAVERAEVPGKIVVYPECKGLALTRLDDLAKKHESIAANMTDGIWTLEAEEELLKIYGE